jgi:hypothetical protein
MIMGDELGIGHDLLSMSPMLNPGLKPCRMIRWKFSVLQLTLKNPGFVLGLEQQRTQEQPVTLETELRVKEHNEVLAEVQRLTNPQIFDAETVQLYHFTFMTLEQTAEEAGYVTYYSRGTGELGEETIRVNYEDSNGNTIPVHTDVVGRGKALTYIGDERVPGTGFSSDNEWQSNALKTALPA